MSLNKFFLVYLWFIISTLLCSRLIQIQPVIDIEGIYVEKVTVTDKLDGLGNPIENLANFSPDTDRIYCFSTIPALAGDKVHTQWYYEDNFIGTIENTVSREGKVSWFLEQPIDQPTFPIGQYRVEIRYQGVELKTVNFDVLNKR